jgi:hypothetical protein
VIATILITIGVEGLVCAAYGLRFRKPVAALLLSCLVANLVTQPILWLILTTFYQHYLATLFVAEQMIVVIEALLLYLIRFNQLRWQEALILSLVMNLASFAAGWFLPV